MKALFKELPRLFDDRDKNVRGEAKNVTIEIHRWIGAASKTLFNELKPVVVSELNAILDALPPEKPVPTRYLRSQKPQEQPEGGVDNVGGQASSGAAAATEVEDEMNLIDPVDVLSKVPNEYWSLITEKKWQERQQALEALEKITNVPLISPGDFSELIRSLLNVVTKDTNIVLATMATRILGQIASGLRKKYAPYAQQTIVACLQKFKERKPTVVAALRDTIDAAAKSTTLDVMVDDVIAALGNKSPGVRSESALFLSRVFARCTQATLTKKLLKTFTTTLCATSVDTVLEVRENSFAALGTAMRVVGAKNIEPFLADLDPLRMNKIKEYSEKVTAEKSEGDSATSRPDTTPASTASKPRRGAPPVQRPGTAAAKNFPDVDSGGNSETQTSAPKSTGGASKRKPGASGKSTSGATASIKATPATETLLAEEQVVQKASEVFGEELINKLSASEWKERFAGMTELFERTKTLDGSTGCPLQVLCRIVLRKPGLKDTNFQVLRVRVEHLQYALVSSKFASATLAELLVPELLEKIGDGKVGDVIRSTLTTLAERSTFELVGNQVLQSVFHAKNPKTQSDSLLWLTQSIQDFGLKLRPQDLITTIRTGLNATNPAVRQASLGLAGVVHLFMGEPMRSLLADEKPAVVALLNTEFDKNAGKKPPVPTRGVSASKAATAGGDVDEEPSESTAAPEEIDTESLLPRVDISGRITATILTLLTSKAWKERQEGLTEIQNILNSAKHIEGGNGALQEPLTAVAKACSDVNKNLCKIALQLLADFAKALPKADAAKYIKFVEPSILLCFGDSKPHIREAAMNAITAWQSRVPIATMLEPEILADALKLENAFLRTEFLRWLCSAFSDLPSNHQRRLPADLTSTLMPFVFATLEDRNPDARKQAQAILPQLIRVLGWDGVARMANKLKSTSKDAVMPQLEKAREAVVAMEPPETQPSRTVAAPKAIRGGASKVESVEPVPSTGQNEDTEETTSSPAESSTAPTTNGKKKTDTKKSVSSASKKSLSEEPAAASLLQANKNAKAARINDEKKRKLLKWDFDAPTRDHVNQLNQLFLSAGASPDLHALLFHADFKQHVKALDQLTRFFDSPEGEEATMANLDLLLRWIVLRFFETNPVVVGRCLDYLIKLFSRMSDSGIALSEYEATALLPYLVLKAGDSKDAVRQNVRSLFKLLVNLYSPNRLFLFVSNGLKSKTNKTRQECLEEMGSLIHHFGVTVCQPTVPVALKSIAQQIGDRDSGVRSAALNALVSAYAIVGEQLWKLIGSLSDKDRSMLEERIKRAARQPGPPEMVEVRSTPMSSARGNRESSAPRRPYEAAQADRQPPMSSAQARARAMLSELGDLSPEKAPSMPPLIQLESDIDDLFKPIEIPALKTQSRQPVLNALLRTSPDTASAITMVVTAISSSDLLVSCRALAELDTVLRDQKWYLLLSHVNQILMLITMQLRQVTTRYFGDPSIPVDQLRTLLRCHLATVDSLFHHSTLGREASRETLRELIQSLLQLLLDERTCELPDGENVIRAINSLCVRIIDAANGTRVLSALIRLLHESVSNGHFNNRFTQAIMKSLWRITKAMDTTVNSYSLDVILLDCHHFLKAFPSPSWKQRKSDVPLRTIKTMLHVLCRLRGSVILDFLENVPNKEESELESYLLRTLKTISGNAVGSTPHSRRHSGTDQRTKAALPSAATREKLAEIFKKVASKQPEEGLNELYDFTQLYPEMDLSVFLSKTSQFFQTYIKQALRNIAVERARQTRATSGGDTDRVRSSFPGPVNGLTDLTNGGSVEFSANGQPVNPKVFMDRLAMLRRELGLGGVSTTNVEESPGLLGPTPQTDGDEQDSKYPTNDETKTKNNGSSTSTSDEPQPEPRPTISASELLEIRMRLERIKSGQPL
ncbi:Cytoskeleton-associated protein 5 [Fasciola hepatica]|uniref:Cytoskeleton-associated protein 5 n=1 Tax=Fasciola hepatica TaxID=6192 RepID=A0A4E0RXG1_FASHE|nr:Cytoskeleton-associated protein 5 [Fasciola hepatica]